MVKINLLTNSNTVNRNISNLKILKNELFKGSESFIYEAHFLNNNVLIKKRKPKKYRNSLLDTELRISRLKIESKIIEFSLNNNIAVPTLYGIDLNEAELIIEFLKGKSLGELLAEENLILDQSKIFDYFTKIGTMTSILHNIEIIHGDLTPFNIFLTNDEKLYLIDFGLSYFSNEVKDKAMDLFIMNSSLKIYNPTIAKQIFDSFLKGYSLANQFENIFSYFNLLENKGRYK